MSAQSFILPDGTRAQPTRFDGLAIVRDAPGLFRIVDRSTGARVGPHYATKAELYGDLERYARVGGWTAAVPAPEMAMQAALLEIRRLTAHGWPDLARQEHSTPWHIVQQCDEGLAGRAAGGAELPAKVAVIPGVTAQELKDALVAIAWKLDGTREAELIHAVVRRIENAEEAAAKA